MKLFKKYQWNNEELRRHCKKWDIAFYIAFAVLILSWIAAQINQTIVKQAVIVALPALSIALAATFYTIAIKTADKKLKK